MSLFIQMCILRTMELFDKKYIPQTLRDPVRTLYCRLCMRWPSCPNQYFN